MHDSVGLRERKKAETRRSIGDAALALAIERGPGNVTVDDIAAAAGISARTVFNYFATKEEAILGVDPERRRLLLDRLRGRPGTESPLEALREAMRESTDGSGAIIWRTRARLARQNPQLHSAYLAAFASLEDDLTEVLAERVGVNPAADPFPRLAVTVALTAMRVSIDHAMAQGLTARDDFAGSVDAAFDAVAAGLRPVTPSRSG